MIQRWIDNINHQSMSPSFEKIEDEDETESPNQLLGSCQGTFITL